MIKKLILIVVLTLIIATGGYFFLNAKDSNNNAVVGETNVETNIDEKDTNSSGALKEFIVDGSNFAFVPSEIKVQKGDTVKIIFKDKAGMHNLVIDGYNVKTKTINGGAEDSVTFVADKLGQFEYYCSVGNHKESGMVGVFIVE